MLRNVLEGYFNSLTEREFDVPFMCLLLEESYYDIHFLHGNYEFGKDFIAKKQVNGKTIQFVFQSKAGDINSTDWREIAYQCEEARTNLLAHPNFDVNADKQTILVTTGRLVGGAALAAQQFDERCKNLGEIGLDVWDENTLIEKLIKCDVGLSGINGVDTDFIGIITLIKQDNVNFKIIEQFSRTWKVTLEPISQKSFYKVILDGALIIHELLQKQKILLACYTCLMIIRSLIYFIHKNSCDSIPQWSFDCLNLVEDMYEHLVNVLISIIMPTVDKEFGLLTYLKYKLSSIITYPVICLQVVENIGLLGLLQFKRKRTESAKATSELLVKIIENNSVFMHPISDKYAVSYIAPIMLISKFNYENICEGIIKNTSKWLCDRYELSEAGLASSDATEEEEIKTLFGYMFSFYDLPSRRESYIATLMLDLSAILNFNKLYDDVINDILATRIFPCIVGTEDIPEQYFECSKQSLYTNIKYKNVLGNEKEDKVAFHHYATTFFCEQNNLYWEAIAIFSVLRDRHRIPVIKQFFDNQ